MGHTRALLLLAAVLFLRLVGALAGGDISSRVCVIGSGIGGASLAHFVKQYTCTGSSDASCIDDIHIFERSGRVGGRMATVTIAGDTFEAGASILHPKNLYALHFASLLNLTHKTQSSEFRSNSSSSSSSSSADSSWFGIWDGAGFRFKTLAPSSSSSSWLYRKIRPFLIDFLIFRRYGLSLLRMNRFVQKMLGRFMHYYEDSDSRPVFETVEEMLKWSGLYGLTSRTLEKELADAGVSPLLMSELITVITRINYGQSINISGLAGAVSLAGSDSGLWSVNGGNWQLAAGLINISKAKLHLHEEITSVSYSEGFYVLNSVKGNNYSCGVTVIATPLDELDISFTPPISIPVRRLQHTYTTFVRGLLNPGYFSLKSVSEIPDLIGTIEDPNLPFSSISVQRKYSEVDKIYKVFSRSPLGDDELDLIFSTRKEIIRIDWPAYPHFEAPEVFAPIMLDGSHLYYINSFENAASTMETSAFAAENVGRLIISRLSSNTSSALALETPLSARSILHVDL